jgi:uncharacterized membrane protein
MMKKTYSILWFVIALQLIVALWLGSGLPSDTRIPIHWNIQGQPDDFVGKWMGILFFPAVNLALTILMLLLPRYSVRYQQSPRRMARTVPVITFIMVVCFALIHLYTLLVAAGRLSSSVQPVLMLIGVLFVLLGNLLPKVPSNFFLGIRTPWTLSSEQVWRKTHRLGGVCFVLAGLGCIIIPLLVRDTKLASSVSFYVMMLLVLFPILYSLILYKRQQ